GPGTPQFYTLSLHDALPIWSCCSRLHGGKCRGQFLLQLLERAVVANHDVRPTRLLVLAELTRGPRLYASVAARARTFGAHRFVRSEEHTSELQSQSNLVCRL